MKLALHNIAGFCFLRVFLGVFFGHSAQRAARGREYWPAFESESNVSCEFLWYGHANMSVMCKNVPMSALLAALCVALRTSGGRI